MGYWSGLFIQRRGVNYRTVALLAATGLAIAAIGQLWHFTSSIDPIWPMLPINRKSGPAALSSSPAAWPWLCSPAA